MQEASNSKQLIADKIKQSANILVTVSSNPSVDALTAALGLTLMLNKLDKHATAVFSGVIPPAITFLEPGKTFENNVDSLRDFIIALDKDKADRLRYKVEDDVVRIFITPYRTKISQTDLQFSQGDFNVDLIIALGVEDQKDLDQAITAHGRILHDATVATINAGSLKSNLGSIDWQDGHASSLSEMLASMADALKAGILDQQISTALLTGIVASTERFSNQKTTPHVMTISAQLMAAGANQQLIATKLQTIPAPVSPRRENPKPQAAPETSKKVSADNADDGEMHINHGEEPKEVPAPLPMEPVAEPEPIEPAPEPELEPELPIAPPAAQNFDDLKQAIQQETVQAAPQREMVDEPPVPGNHNINDSENDDEKPEDEESYLTSHPSWQGRELKPPTMGGTLSATSEQALEDKIRSEKEEKRNLKILTHGGGGEAQPAQPQQQSSSSKRRKRKKGGQGGQQQDQQQQPQGAAQPAPAPAAPTPVVAPTPAPAPVEPAPQAAMPEPTPEPALEIPAPAPEPVAPAPEMPLPAPAPEPAPAPAPEPEQALPEIPVAPPPMVVAEPLTPPAEPVPVAPNPTPTPEQPAPQAPHEPTLEELEREAANHAAQAVAPQTLSELEAEAHAHAAKVAAPQAGPNPAPVPASSELGAMPMPQPLETPTPATPTPVPAPQPEMSPTGLPPLPPMPDFSTLPPVPASPELPQLPQQPLQQPAVPQPPQQAPQPPQAPPMTPPPAAPTDPAQFRIPGQ